MNPKRSRPWRNGWTNKIRPIEVGSTLRIVPYWETLRGSDQRREIIIDPGVAFGAGNHPTTQMALEFLETAMFMAQKECGTPTVLDAGTGTGILALAAKALGSGLTIGFDIDSSAVFCARRNTALNRWLWHDPDDSPVQWYIGEIRAIGRTFDVVTANLAAPTLLAVRRDLVACVKRYLVLSGIAEALVDDVIQAYLQERLDCLAKGEREGWYAVFLSMPMSHDSRCFGLALGREWLTNSNPGPSS